MLAESDNLNYYFLAMLLFQIYICSKIIVLLNPCFIFSKNFVLSNNRILSNNRESNNWNIKFSASNYKNYTRYVILFFYQYTIF